MHTTIKQVYVLMLSAESYLEEAKKNKVANCSGIGIGYHGPWEFKTVDKLIMHWIEDECTNHEWWR